MQNKFPSIFKTAKYQRFNITPRYYDPVKEDLARREARVKRELRNGESDTTDYQDHIQGSFKRYSSKTNKQSALIRLVVLLLLISLAMYFIF